MTCSEFEELSGAYVLDAITPNERREADAHLATCARCSQLLAELRRVVDVLPLSVPQINPPESLQERVMDAVRQEAARPASPISFRHPPRRSRARLQNVSYRTLAVAAVLLLVLLGGLVAWNISLQHQVASLHQQSTQTSVSTYTVHGTNQAQGSTGELVYFAAQRLTVLIMHGLPPLQGTHVYQGWLVHMQGQHITGVTSVGLLNVSGGTATLSFSGNVTGYDAAAISLEPGPKATSVAPKGPVIALGSLKQTALGLPMFSHKQIRADVEQNRAED
jgi:anti-sigma-K factor RskA